MKAEIEGRTLTIIRSASDTGSLYGSVTNRDVEQAMEFDGLVISRKQIVLTKPIKEKIQMEGVKNNMIRMTQNELPV